ncbi:MAG: hypothetical protein V3V08_18245 [Nannocystaceae bacterium]
MANDEWIASSLEALEELQAEHTRLERQLDAETNPDSLRRVSALLDELDRDIENLYGALSAAADAREGDAREGDESAPADPKPATTAPSRKTTESESVIMDVSMFVESVEDSVVVDLASVDPLASGAPVRETSNRQLTEPSARASGRRSHARADRKAARQPAQRRRPRVETPPTDEPTLVRDIQSVLAEERDQASRSESGFDPVVTAEHAIEAAQRASAEVNQAEQLAARQREAAEAAEFAAAEARTRATRAVRTLISELDAAAEAAKSTLARLRVQVDEDGRALAARAAASDQRARKIEASARAMVAEAKQAQAEAKKERAVAQAAAAAASESADARDAELQRAQTVFEQAHRAAQTARADPSRLLEPGPDGKPIEQSRTRGPAKRRQRSPQSGSRSNVSSSHTG